jgi:hypothetical protein
MEPQGSLLDPILSQMNTVHTFTSNFESYFNIILTSRLCSTSGWLFWYTVYWNKKFWEEQIAYFPLTRHRPHKNDASNKSSIVAYVFVAAEMFLPSRCLATVVIHRQTHRPMGGIYEVRRWDGLRYRDMHTKFHKDWFRHSNLDRGDTQAHRQHGDRISLLLFFWIRKVGY